MSIGEIAGIVTASTVGGMGIWYVMKWGMPGPNDAYSEAYGNNEEVRSSVSKFMALPFPADVVYYVREGRKHFSLQSDGYVNHRY